VFALTNAADDNQVVAFSRDDAGKLTQTGIYSTGGQGQGVDFDTQGGLQLSDDNRFLYAVSPADDKVSVFAVQGSCLTRIQDIYGGDQPLSITLNNGLAYVLDGSVATTGIRGFRVQSNGQLEPIGNSTIPLSTLIGVPGTVLFNPDGKNLIVTNKVGSTIDFFEVDGDGKAQGPVTTTASSGNRPFGAFFRGDGVLFVVESGLPILTNAAVSTYDVGSTGALSAITKSEKNQQTDGCWIVVPSSGKFAYTANFASGTISSYSAATDGTVALIDGIAANQGNGSEPVDLALSRDSKFMYNLLRGFGAISGHQIQDDGSLKSVGVFGQGQGLPPDNGASGLAAY